MALEAYLDSIGKLVVPLATPAHNTGSLLESLSSSMSCQSDALSEAATASYLNMPPSGNLSAYIARMARLNANLVSGNANSIVLNYSTGSVPSVGLSSLVTDANSPLAGAAHLPRCGSTNMDSYLNLPSSPFSFSSNNYCASVTNASSKAKPKASRRDQNSQVGQKRPCQQLQVGGTVTSQKTSQTHQGSLPTGNRQEPGINPLYKKPRLDTNQANILHQKIIQQLLQKQDPKLLQDHNQLLQALMHQHKQRNQQPRQILQSIPQFVGVPAEQQLQQQVRHHLQHQANHQISAVHPHDDGICSRRLMQYIYHQRHRPPDNSIAYWRKFVAEYYALGAKKRWCLSSYDNIGEHALGVFSSAMEAWHCNLCGSESGKGFEAVFQILSRLSKINFESGVIDELLYLDFPHECRLSSGLMMLRYGKAVQESVYEQFRVAREGQLCIIFRHDLKILSWVFCARRHEELGPRSLVAPQVNQLIQAAKKCQSTTKDGGSNGVSPQGLQFSCNLFVKAGRQLTQNLDLVLVNDLGFSKRYVRCLQIAEVVNYMKELMTFSGDNNFGPIESLRKYPRKETTTKNQIKQMHETEWLASAEVSPGSSNNMNENSCMNKDETVTGTEKVESAGMNYYQNSPRQNYAVSTVKQEHSCSINSSSQSAVPSPILGPQSSSPQVIKNSPVSNLSTFQPSQGIEDLQQHMIQKLLQEMVSNSSRAKGIQNANTKVKEEVLDEFDPSAVGQLSTSDCVMATVGSGLGLGNASVAAAPNVLGSTPGRRDCFKAASDGNSTGNYGGDNFVKREPAIPEKFHLPQAVWDMDFEFFRNGVLNDDDWKA